MLITYIYNIFPNEYNYYLCNISTDSCFFVIHRFPLTYHLFSYDLRLCSILVSKMLFVYMFLWPNLVFFLFTLNSYNWYYNWEICILYKLPEMDVDMFAAFHTVQIFFCLFILVVVFVYSVPLIIIIPTFPDFFFHFNFFVNIFSEWKLDFNHFCYNCYQRSRSLMFHLNGL